MAEVTRSNFEKMMPDIEESIRNASFIAIDAEFTGLKVGCGDRVSLFDSMEERYKKLKIRATSFTISQIGLSVFVKHPTENSYQVKTFVFYIRPFLCGNIDKNFLCQASCLDFLCRYDFDFNKVFKEGIPFMNEAEVKQLTEEIKEERFRFPYNFLDREKDLLISEKLLKVEKSPIGSRRGRRNDSLQKSKILHFPKDKLYPAYFQIMQIKNKYPSLSAYTTKDEIIVERETSKQERYLTEEKEKALDFCLGFTKVFRLLKKAQKPIVGHNFLMDLLLCFQNFHEPLPDKYKDFKKEVCSMFPAIYDTRQIWMNIKKFSILEKVPQQFALFEMYQLFKSPPPHLTTLYHPDIEFCNGNRYAEGEFPHESGYDSFVTGWVFLNICHVIAIKKAKSRVFIEPQTFKQYVNAVAPFVNKVNLSRSRYGFIDFGGDDPSPSITEMLYVCKKNSGILNEKELSMIFARHGLMDIKVMADRRQALIAVANKCIYKEILNEFENHEHFVITQYSMFRHLPYLNGILWLTAIGSVCAVAFLVTRLIKEL